MALPGWLEMVASALPVLALGVAGALVGGAIVLIAQWLRQRRIDHAEWPFEVTPFDLAPADPGAKFRQLRVWFYNPTSFPVFLIVELRYFDAPSGRYLSAGSMNIRLAWADRPEDAKLGRVPVPPKGAVEFWVDFDYRKPEGAPDPTELYVFASRTTFRKGTNHSYPLRFDKHFGDKV